jgi:glycosyltransferase involved in cell wall biosynthesis
MAVDKDNPFLDIAIKSILEQTLENFEFIIVVDGRNPKLLEKIQKEYKADPRVILLIDKLGGLAFSLNLGIASARGQYLARMDADDVSKLNRLQAQADYLDSHVDVSVLGSRVELIDSNTVVIDRDYRFYETDKEIRRVLSFRNPLVHPALMFRRTALLNVQGYKYGHSSEDHEMFLRMARDRSVKFHNLDQILFQYRRHGAQATRPERMKWHFVEISGFLFTEFLLDKSPKHIFGMLIIHPWVRKTRLLFRRLATGSRL